jgi:DNA replication licensing factor MCM4
MLDPTDEAWDTKLAKHLVGLYLTERPVSNTTIVVRYYAFDVSNFKDVETFAAYISFAREAVHPQMTDQCIDLISEEYVRLRQLGNSKHVISATTRQLEALIRLSEAHARMRLSELVEKQDVDEAIRLIKEAMKASAIDPVTGMLDMDLLTTGVSSRERSNAQLMKREVLALLKTMGSDGVSKDDVFRAFQAQSTTVFV